VAESNVDPRQASQGLGVPMRVERPPASTTPPAHTVPADCMTGS